MPASPTLGGALPDGALDERHPDTTQIARFFEYSHLTEELRPVSGDCAWLAAQMIQALPDGPELTAGLRKLLEAKDCFVRGALREVD